MPSVQWKIREIPFVSTRYTLCKTQPNITTLSLAGIANRHPVVTDREAPIRLPHRRMFFVVFCTCAFASIPRERQGATSIQILRKLN